MNTSKIIKAYIRDGTYSTTEPIIQGDYGYILQIEGVVLPSVYRVDFSNNRHNGEALPVYGNENGVEVPEELIATGKDIFAFYYYIGENFGKTAYTWKIPNDTRAKIGNRVPTPTQQDSIDQLVVRSNEAVERAEQAKADAETAQGKAEEAQEAAETAQRKAEDAQGASERAKQFAEQSAADAQTSASQASASATASAQSASQSAQIKADVEDLVDDAQASANASAQSASASANSASQASASATSASQSATSAQGYASQAQTSAQTASSKATEASTSASTASTKASEASASALSASGYATQAEQAKTSAQTAQGLAESARDLAQGYAEDAQGYANDAQASAEGISASASQIAQNTANILKAFPTDTASGAIASFSDGADDIPLKSLTVNIDPVQDLHGYDSPWVGGGGKNLLKNTAENTTVNGITFTVNSDGSVTANGTATANAVLIFPINELVNGESYILNGCPSGGSGTTYEIMIIPRVNGQPVANQYGADKAFTYNIETYKFIQLVVRNNYTASNLVFKPMIRKSTESDASYAPYENICPISGWTGATVNATGKNLIDITAPEKNGYYNVNGSPSSSSSYSCFLVSCKPNTTYTLKGGFAGIRTYWDKDLNFISGMNYGSADPKTFTTPSGAFFFRMSILKTNIDGTQQLELGSSDTAYEPYKGRTINVNWEDEAGTVYGGKLDVLSGVMTVDRAIVDLGTLTWSYQASPDGIKLPRFASASIASAINKDIDVQGGLVGETACSALVLSKTVVVSRTVDHAYCALTATGLLYVVDTDYSDVASFTSGMSGVQLLYPLAEPIEIQLTPHEVNSLLGQNNIFADTGDCSVEYRADTTLYISRLTEPDADMIADSNIVSGQYFMVGNSLFKATANIASGSAVTVGTNAIRKSLSEALNEINA